MIGLLSIKNLGIMRRVLLSSMLCFVFFVSNAQIVGKVLAENSNALSYANVSLYSLPDSTFISGTITDEQGKYVIADVDSMRSAFLKISAIGYVTKYVFPIRNELVIYLVSSDYYLGTATVSSKREIFKSRGTDLIADIQHSNFRDFGFANDIIDKLPMVSGERGSYNIFGKGNAVIYVGNRKLSDPSELARIATKDIATIEVISNPGPKYDADTHAVIKINLKSKVSKGWGGMVALTDGQGRRNSDYEQAQLTYDTDKFNSFFVFSNSSSRYSTDQNNTEKVSTSLDEWTLYSNMPRWESNYLNQTLTAGLSLNINKSNSLGGQVSYQKEKDRYNGVSDNLISQDVIPYEHLSSSIASHSHYDQWQSNLYYEGHVGNKWNISLNGDYLRRNSNDRKNNDEVGTLTELHNVWSSNRARYDIAAALLEVEYLWNKSFTFKFGSNVSYVKDVKSYCALDDKIDYSCSSLTSKETKVGFFAEGDLSFGKLNANIGTRYEILKMSYRDDLAYQYLVDKHYEKFYPYVSVSMHVSHTKMALSLTTKVQRPSYYQLRNSLEYFNRYETEAGNPLLLPQYTTDLSYSLQYKNFRFSMSYQWIKDYIMYNNIIDLENPLHITSQPQNKPHYSSLNTYLSYNKTIGIWEFYVNLNAMRTFFNVYNLDGSLANGKRPYAELSFNNYFNLKHDWMPYIWLRYNNDGYMREYRISQAFLVSVGVTKHFFKNALYARLSINNLLGSKERETRYATNYSFNKSRFKDNRSVSIFLRYTFNNKKKYHGKNAASEEINRM